MKVNNTNIKLLCIIFAMLIIGYGAGKANLLSVLRRAFFHPLDHIEISQIIASKDETLSQVCKTFQERLREKDPQWRVSVELDYATRVLDQNAQFGSGRARNVLWNILLEFNCDAYLIDDRTILIGEPKSEDLWYHKLRNKMAGFLDPD